jgi:hypothetical protein
MFSLKIYTSLKLSCRLAIQQTVQNQKDLEGLKNTIEKLNALFASFIAPSSLLMPAELMHRIETVSMYLLSLALRLLIN